MNVRKCMPGEWQELRELRLRALADAPAAFGGTLAESQARPAEEWQAAAQPHDEAVLYVWEDDAGRLNAMAVGRWHDDQNAVEVTGMWVAPGGRRLGVGHA